MPTTTPAPARPPIPRQLWVLIAAALVIALGFGLITPVLPQYARSFDVGIAAASVIVSAFAFMRLVFAPAGGALIGRFGERPVYLWGLIIVAVSTGATAFATSYWQLLLFRGLGGVGSTMFTVSAMGLMVRLAPPAIRGRVASYYGSAFLIGNITGPLAGSALAGFGYRVPFLVYAVALLIAVTLVWRLLSGASLRPVPGAPVLPPLTVREALRHPSTPSLLCSLAANGWMNFGVRVALVPMFAAAVPGIGAAMAGVLLTGFAVGNAAALQFSGRLVDRHGRRPLVISGLVVSGVATLGFGWSSTVPVALALSVLAGGGAGLVNPAQQAAGADIVGSERSGGSVLAMFQMFGDGGAILGPILAGWVADTVGFGWAFALTGLISLAAAAAWLPALETMPRQDRPTAAGASGTVVS
ncbi:MAG: MFS transporter [Austwickia sp.]|jgi:ACDE family multidrug resistance protein|nr:MFS transporter [Austwickia sp.]MBK8437629.1 MFS transporter [Austwickia sp.]MBK9102923.1 MFS transporter [Austwickia sp.]